MKNRVKCVSSVIGKQQNGLFADDYYYYKFVFWFGFVLFFVMLEQLFICGIILIIHVQYALRLTIRKLIPLCVWASERVRIVCFRCT